jgi:hypothetical protein
VGNNGSATIWEYRQDDNEEEDNFEMMGEKYALH